MSTLLLPHTVIDAVRELRDNPHTNPREITALENLTQRGKHNPLRVALSSAVNAVQRKPPKDRSIIVAARQATSNVYSARDRQIADYAGQDVLAARHARGDADTTRPLPIAHLSPAPFTAPSQGAIRVLFGRSDPLHESPDHACRTTDDINADNAGSAYGDTRRDAAYRIAQKIQECRDPGTLTRLVNELAACQPTSQEIQACIPKGGINAQRRQHVNRALRAASLI